ncbi:hypothetical protein BC830DRAFT_1234827, partial [Chytriomyces sp. MP71]
RTLIPRGGGILFTVLASPLISCLPYVCGCFGQQDVLFKARYLHSIGFGAQSLNKQ